MTTPSLPNLLPPVVRFWIYVVFGLGSVVVTYLTAKEVIGLDEVALWTGLGTVVGATSASNVDRVKRTNQHAQPKRRPRGKARNRGG